MSKLSVRPGERAGRTLHSLGFGGRSSLLGGSSSLGSSLAGGDAGSLLLLDIAGHQALVFLGSILGGLEALELLSLEELLAAEVLLSDEALNLGGLVVSLVTALNLTASDVAAHIVLLGEAENLGNVASSLLEETGSNVLGGAAVDFLVALLDDLEGNDTEVRAGDATADGASSSVAGSLGVEERAL